jgi:hypothetical protein
MKAAFFNITINIVKRLFGFVNKSIGFFSNLVGKEKPGFQARPVARR